MQRTSASPANDNRAATTTSGRRATGTDPQAQARGREIVRLHQTLEDWRDRRRLADAAGWPALAAQVIGIEIRALEREVARRVRELF
ncbi:hypothetical protein MSC49_40210 (plasmid) [Methylosinus sp. C49]|uniref:hypothetical protein n=1 Tax=Methylosinus sp. C49 TaxID=2699395 RepID=UPI001367709A|nr:hypothetical protein [Methylosinus sp. C49]BBU64086.1 hypothetical protein MSC49_40210 [Methylosinus sp. C49]